ncbi:hypothetical protein [Microbacterium sp. TPD7012]|uniref:hypothetical protein n=1 Tax=Microbacterium sp. TPD7012 TaxID=2171975 RepID=UPI000D51B27F|nr:hypothetical protein [Microbacterium sp. TPD7012]PVE94108.1 hypothetical protein DC434_15230 [Microbacterium sp. TPD7012]
MDDVDLSEIELIADGDGLALIGPSTAVEQFLTANRLESRDLELPRLGKAFGGGSAALKAGSEITANSGRWMKLTEESWAAAQKLPKVTNTSSGNLHATLRAPSGQFAKNLQFLKTPGAMLTNPAMLAGVAGIMAQLAMQQTMDEITDYLAIIDEKVDDVLRAQKDAVLADMIGVDMMLEEALTIRKEVGGVSEVTWSKVQGSSMTIARTQAYFLRQLDALAEKLESKSVNELADLSKKVDRQVQDWLAVLAHCFYLQESTGVIEIDRVLQTSPEELDRHRIALRTARANRAELITRTTRQLLERMDAAAALANSKVLLNPIESPAIVRSRNAVSNSVGTFHERLGIEAAADALESRRWSNAVSDTRDDWLKAGGDSVDTALRIGTEGVEAAARIGAEGVDKAKEIAGSFADFAGRAFRRRAPKGEADE